MNPLLDLIFPAYYNQNEMPSLQETVTYFLSQQIYDMSKDNLQSLIRENSDIFNEIKRWEQNTRLIVLSPIFWLLKLICYCQISNIPFLRSDLLHLLKFKTRVEVVLFLKKQNWCISKFQESLILGTLTCYNRFSVWSNNNQDKGEINNQIFDCVFNCKYIASFVLFQWNKKITYNQSLKKKYISNWHEFTAKKMKIKWNVITLWKLFTEETKKRKAKIMKKYVALYREKKRFCFFILLEQAKKIQIQRESQNKIEYAKIKKMQEERERIENRQIFLVQHTIQCWKHYTVIPARLFNLKLEYRFVIFLSQILVLCIHKIIPIITTKEYKNEANQFCLTLGNFIINDKYKSTVFSYLDSLCSKVIQSNFFNVNSQSFNDKRFQIKLAKLSSMNSLLKELKLTCKRLQNCIRLIPSYVIEQCRDNLNSLFLVANYSLNAYFVLRWCRNFKVPLFGTFLSSFVGNNIVNEWLNSENKENCTIQSKLEGAIDANLKMMMGQNLQVPSKSGHVCSIFMNATCSADSLQVLELRADQIYVFLKKTQYCSQYTKQEHIFNISSYKKDEEKKTLSKKKPKK